MTTTYTMTLLQKARGQLLVKHPFFASILMATEMVVTETIPTAATDMVKIFYNPTFMNSLSIPKIHFVIAHELCHILFKHGLRRNGRDQRIWNIACDYVINLFLQKCGFEIWEQAYLDTKFDGMSAEQVYDLIYDDEKKKQGRNKLAGGGSVPRGQDDGMGPDLQDPPGLGDPGAIAKIDNGIQQKIAQATMVARTVGKMPGELARLIETILEPEVPWPTVLRDYMTRASRDEETWSRRDRRFQQFYLPTRNTVNHMGEIIFIGDTSGSMTERDLARAIAEITSVADMMKPERIRLVWADACVSSEQEFDEGFELDFKPTGGGGTDMRVPLKHVEQYNPQVVVLMTDGYTPWPTQDPPYPLIVLCTTNQEVPVGMPIRVTT